MLASLRGIAALSLLGALGCSEPVPPQPASGPAPPPAPHALRPSEVASEAGQRVDLVKKAMGTRVVLAAYTSPSWNEAKLRGALRAGYDEIVRLEKLMTTWDDDSEVSRINAAAGKRAIAVSDETFEVIEKSLWISELSEGTFDITFASMGDLWKFDDDKAHAVPSDEAIEKAREKIDYRRVKLDPEAKTVKLERADTRINLGGIAKGYAIDRAADVLRQAGLESFYAQAGGDLYIEGEKPDGTPWKVGVRDPRGPEDTFFAIVPVQDHAFSTAGDYERAFVKAGRRYHHILDPRTGHPARESRSVTIWAKDALTADAIDDAVFILGPIKGMQLVDSIEDCGAIIVDEQNGVHISGRLKGLVTVLRDPSPGI